MATENLGKMVSFTAGEDLSTKQFYPVKIHTNGTIKLAADTDAVVGILQEAGITEGNVGGVMISGISKFRSNDTLTPGEVVMPGTSGMVTATTGKKVIGIVLESANAGELGSILFIQPSIIA